MSMKRNLLLIPLAFVMILSACEALPVFGKEKLARNPISGYGQLVPVTEQRNALQHFITETLTGPHGTYTNLQETDQNSEVATGHEVLSESAGLLMRYYALTGQKDKFDAQWQLAKRTFDAPTGLSYRYSPKLNKKFTVNATVDDFRILRALDEAGEAFQTDAYKKDLAYYGDKLYTYNVSESRLRDFYDETYAMTNSFITLCYIDVASMELLPVSNRKKRALETDMLGIMQGGYLSDSFPFYQTRYDFKLKAYQSEQINSVESLLTILNLAEIGEAKPTSLQWIKAQVTAGTLVGAYDRNGKPLNDVRSTAIYAITAMIGSVTQDKQLYNESITKMNAFQNHTQGSPMNGGFGDELAQQAYSFDNAMALLAYVY
ncbi:hypothetical protein P5G65_22355 [Paenibacillus chondroitinus]|uniref:Glycosyl hydrolase family 8 n=1 Tax=Paenibacillus chondroitinus TaxID=59842 RepID=A0ABU6DIH2_9BACL|nr:MULTISPECIES: hypothetical protein [Paenibacillus]MCY9662719.1 hypothetical protein [Paenibacillus anseongense]MEB4796656.1 hypothetical protein [Paenibacillus chondroitinus]